jgi:4-hydroxy-3-methylbut-2-en-1-yl diphosphate synthase IspG/GcpE
MRNTKSMRPDFLGCIFFPVLNNACMHDCLSVCLQGSRMRNTKTEYVSCPSCGRTLFDLQEVTEQIRQKTGHLPGEHGSLFVFRVSLGVFEEVCVEGGGKVGVV